MSKQLFVELCIVILLIFLLLFVLNPLNIFMPPMNIALGACIILFLLLIVTTFFWQERTADERDEYHRARAAHLSFFAGATILIFGIFSDLLNHTVDPWLIIALSSMVSVKIIARMYLRIKQ